MALTDGEHIVEMPSARDYKRARDGETGPNTGGMGAYSPAAFVDAATAEQIRRDVFEPAAAGLRNEGISYRGCLYAGLMLTERGPRVLEFNARFGDPETQAVLPRLRSDLCALLMAAASGTLRECEAPAFSAQTCVAVVLTTEGYPELAVPARDLPLPQFNGSTPAMAFWGASVRHEDAVHCSGGRVLTLAALADGLPQARSRAYAAVAQYLSRRPPSVRLVARTDIAAVH
jgi:phosphoribosylamine--glycine ligase